MTSVEFHFNVADRMQHACRLLRKAFGQGAQVVVTGDANMLRELDTALWTFGPAEFVPHCGDDAPAAVLDATPIVFSVSPRSAPHEQTLVNLGPRIPDGFERFERLIEIVTQDVEDRAVARDRWKHYASRGYALDRKEIG